MNIERIPIANLLADPANVRLHDKKNIDAIKGSLLKFGQQKNIVVDGNGIVVAGNGTLEAAKQLGWSDIYANRTELTGAEAVAYAVADNRTGELAEWDAGALSKTLEQLGVDGFDLSAIGFDESDLAKMIKTEAEPGLCGDDDVPEQVEPKSKIGDLYLLGGHYECDCGEKHEL